jgi:hypothetical protein
MATEAVEGFFVCVCTQPWSTPSYVKSLPPSAKVHHPGHRPLHPWVLHLPNDRDASGPSAYSQWNEEPYPWSSLGLENFHVITCSHPQNGHPIQLDT